SSESPLIGTTKPAISGGPSRHTANPGQASGELIRTSVLSVNGRPLPARIVRVDLEPVMNLLPAGARWLTAQIARGSHTPMWSTTRDADSSFRVGRCGPVAPPGRVVRYERGAAGRRTNAKRVFLKRSNGTALCSTFDSRIAPLRAP